MRFFFPASRVSFFLPFFFARVTMRGKKCAAARRLAEGTDDVVSDVPPTPTPVAPSSFSGERETEKNGTRAGAWRGEGLHSFDS